MIPMQMEGHPQCGPIRGLPFGQAGRNRPIGVTILGPVAWMAMGRRGLDGELQSPQTGLSLFRKERILCLD